jgi:hypothetical protein
MKVTIKINRKKRRKVGKRKEVEHFKTKKSENVYCSVRIWHKSP